MVLEKDHDRIARWNHDKNCWSIEDRTLYRWTDIKGRAITDWFNNLDQALQYALSVV